MNTSKKIISILMCVLMVLTMVPMIAPTSMTAHAATTNTVGVGGVEMTDGTYLANGATATTTTKPTGGYAYYKDGTLTLNNYEYEGKGYEWEFSYYAGIYGPTSLNIVLNGSNKIAQAGGEREYDCIYSKGDVVVSGTGSLTLSGGYSGIWAEADVTIDGGTITIQDVSVGINNDNITVNGGIINVTTKEVPLCGLTITINGGELTLVSTDTYKDSSYYAMKSDSITIADELEVQASAEPNGTLVDYVAADNNTYDRVVIKCRPVLDDDAEMTLWYFDRWNALMPELPSDASNSTKVTWEMALAYMLRSAGLEESQLGVYPQDYIAFANSLGLISYDKERTFNKAKDFITCGEYEALKSSENYQKLVAALAADKLQPLFINGMAQPIFPFTSGAVVDNYTNESSDIIRYCVYVETDYDTDGDGKLDLVKAVVQLPRAAMEGDYKAATIYDARQYAAGTTNRSSVLIKETDAQYDVYKQPAKRQSAGTATTAQAAEKAESSDWYYRDSYTYNYENLDWYNYYLVRGYAVVLSAGIGTAGSEGIVTAGSDIEIDAYKCIIEWLAGDRVAYTDKTNNIAISADWSNQKVGMTGRSSAAAAQFGIATTGVKGLETIVPVAGFASWYDYLNAQGIRTGSTVNYLESFAQYISSRANDAADYATIEDNLGYYLYNLKEQQLQLNGDYSPKNYRDNEVWYNRDYTKDYNRLNCSALIVHGLNDYNSRTKQAWMMYQSFAKSNSGKEVKMLLHQDGHLTPTYPSGNFSFDIGDEFYDSILNKWFSHYLYGVDNDVENMPNVIAQDSHELGKWNTYDSPEMNKYVTIETVEKNATTITSEYVANGVNSRNWQNLFIEGAPNVSIKYTTKVDRDTTIVGVPEVHFSAKVANVNEAVGDQPIEDRDALMVSAMLVDIAPEGETFDVFNTEGSYISKHVLVKGGAWLGGGLPSYDLVQHKLSNVSYKIITRGWMDLANPDAGWEGYTANTKVKLGGENQYNLYLQPTIYEVQEGHTLALILYSYEPGLKSYSQNYSITVKDSDVKVVLPHDGDINVTLKAVSNAHTHSWNAGTVTKEATCVAEGVKTYTCVCGETKTESIAKKTTHTWNSGKITTDSTCAKTGVKTYTCTVSGCGKTKTESVAKKAHTLTTLKAVAATCTKTGLTEGKKCSACGEITEAQKTVAKKAHTYKNITTKATLTKNGKVENKCSVCGYVSKTTTVYYPKTIKLSATEYTYNKKVKTPTVTVKDSKGNTLKKDTDYTVSYESGRKVPGKYTVKITFKGKYDGVKRLYFTIKPRVTSKITASQTTTTITLKWTAVTGADGYRVYKYNSKTKKYEKLKDVTKNTLKISKLKAGTAYKYKVRAFTKDDGTIYGSYSDVFETATKCKTPSITKLTTTKGKASFTWSNVTGESGFQVYYATSKGGTYKKVKSYSANKLAGSKTKLKSGKRYYFKVRAYKKTASGTVYSSWSAVKSVKIK